MEWEATFGLASLRHWIPTLARGPRFDVTIAVCPPMQTAFLPLVYRALHGVPMVFHVQDLQLDAALSAGLGPYSFRS